MNGKVKFVLTVKGGEEGVGGCKTSTSPGIPLDASIKV